ncbi:hypothetical protein Poly59_31440 [Rubripirellula reticaptiva]|uniref:Knr4/Smi1-like domain-containing protein n=1 Tax=Rubripirellula reticaptiva TaxID=2528013 RepID=A0A5C6EWE0_9BACT|nr:hypothetical protein Poly59_31440 [Rubripirellula reticaptiva]
MQTSVASNLLHHLADDSAEIGHASVDDKAWLEELPLPLELKRTLQWHWPTESTQIGPIVFEPVSGIRSYPWTPALLRHQQIPIGFGPNGDAFVCDFATDECNVGFVTHEEYDGASNSRPFYQPTFRTLESYLHLVDMERYVPCDYYDARDFAEFLEAESNHSPFFRHKKA